MLIYICELDHRYISFNTLPTILLIAHQKGASDRILPTFIHVIILECIDAQDHEMR